MQGTGKGPLGSHRAKGVVWGGGWVSGLPEGSAPWSKGVFGHTWQEGSPPEGGAPFKRILARPSPEGEGLACGWEGPVLGGICWSRSDSPTCGHPEPVGGLAQMGPGASRAFLGPTPWMASSCGVTGTKPVTAVGHSVSWASCQS